MLIVLIQLLHQSHIMDKAPTGEESSRRKWKETKNTASVWILASHWLIVGWFFLSSLWIYVFTFQWNITKAWRQWHYPWTDYFFFHHCVSVLFHVIWNHSTRLTMLLWLSLSTVKYSIWVLPSVLCLHHEAELLSLSVVHVPANIPLTNPCLCCLTVGDDTNSIMETYGGKQLSLNQLKRKR